MEKVNDLKNNLSDNQNEIDINKIDNSEWNDKLDDDVIDEIISNTGGKGLKEKNLKRKKLIDLQSIAVSLNIAINKIIDGKIKNKTKEELCLEIIQQ